MGSHPSKSCTVKLQMCRRCQRGPHHTILCKTFDRPAGVNTSEQQNESINQSTVSSVPSNSVITNVINTPNNTFTTRTTRVALATAMASLEQSGVQQPLRVFFDNGSQRTFITRKLVEKSGLPIKLTERMTLTGFMGQPNTKAYRIVKPLLKMGNRRKRLTAVVVEELPQTIIMAGITDAIRELTSIGIKLADPVIGNDKVGPIDLLIGSDHYYDFIATNIIVRRGIHLLNSPSGYIMSGKIPTSFKSSLPHENGSNNYIPESVIVMKVTEHLDPLVDSDTHLQLDNPPVHKLWGLDVTGIDVSQQLPEDKASYQEYLKTVQFDKGQYWVKLPWKLNKPDLPNNYGRALGQMHSLVKELLRKNKVQTYQKVLDDQIMADFIEEVSDAQPTSQSHYLPHHAVVKDSVTTPLRIVFNCSSKTKQTVSLNDCLMTGPTMTQKLGDVLLRFRTDLYAYTADISKAFLRIGLQEADRDYTRFLWPSDPHDPQSSIKTYRFKSVLFGATSSPFLLQATIDHHLKTSESPLKDILATNFYVDNFQGTSSNEGELLSIYKEANKEMEKANMPLRQWNTNNPRLQEFIKKDYPEYEMAAITTILGLCWNTQDDTLSVKPVKHSTTDSQALSKRSLLSKVSQVFDPLGIYAPITIKGRLLIQEAWALKIEWDDSLPDHFADKWKDLEAEFCLLPNLKVPRFTAGDSDECSLHTFCDASSRAYGAAAYVVTSTTSGLLTSKTRVAPIKNRTIPQLELTALLVGTKLATYILETLKHLKISKVYMWSDSEVALQWLKSDCSKIPYVKNRVAEILQIQKNFSFKHVGTKSNPTDMLSRGVPLKELSKSSLWFTGPEWLTEPNQWPEQKSFLVSPICDKHKMAETIPIAQGESRHGPTNVFVFRKTASSD